MDIESVSVKESAQRRILRSAVFRYVVMASFLAAISLTLFVSLNSEQLDVHEKTSIRDVHHRSRSNFPMSSKNSPMNCTFAPTDCHNHGVCNQNGDGCICFDRYTTFQAPNGTQCNYQKKDQLGAFLLSFFLGAFGAGRFYVGDIMLGLIKLLVPFVIMIISCVMMCCLCCVSSDGGSACLTVIAYTLCVLSSLTVLCWWLADVIMFGMNTIVDGNGIALYPW